MNVNICHRKHIDLRTRLGCIFLILNVCVLLFISGCEQKKEIDATYIGMPVVKYNENIVDLSKLEIYYGFGHDVKNFFSTVEDLETFLKSQNDGFCILATVVQVPTCGSHFLLR